MSEITGTSSQKLRHLPRKRRRGFRSCVLSFFPFSLMALSSSPQILHVAPQADIVDHDAVRRELEANGTPLPSSADLHEAIRNLFLLRQLPLVNVILMVRGFTCASAEAAIRCLEELPEEQRKAEETRLRERLAC